MILKPTISFCDIKIKLMKRIVPLFFSVLQYVHIKITLIKRVIPLFILYVALRAIYIHEGYIKYHEYSLIFCEE